MGARGKHRTRRLATVGLAGALILAAAGAAVAVPDSGGASAASAERLGQAGTADAGLPQNRLRSFGTCKRFRRYVRRHTARMRRSGDWSFFSPTGGWGADSDDSSLQAAPPPSPTNVQEPGVDEPDSVKTAGPDGTVILAIDRGRLRAVDASSPKPVEVGSLALPTGPGKQTRTWGTELLVHGDRALVISQAWGRNGIWRGWFAPRVVINEVAIGNPAAMRAVRTEVVEGSYLSARLTGGTARVVLSDQAQVAGPVPTTLLLDRVAGERTQGPLHRCGETHRPRRFSGLQTASVLTIDLDRGLPAADADTVISGGGVVYASPNGLYLATERWFTPRRRSRLPQLHTHIHRFDTSDAASTHYASSGRVRGYMLSQWSMSEHDGHLRVATTTRPPWTAPRRPSRSLVTVLREEDARLAQVGRVGGMGEGERIHAVRFVGEHGFVVTFRQIDPLYTLDLSDPADPRVLGELKMPGFSAYLHPVGDDRMLGIGRHATRTGRLRGSKASLFDLTDLGAPARIGKLRLGGRRSSSPVERDHRAFLYDPERMLGVVPVRDPRRGGGSFGAAVLRVTSSEIELLGRIEHTPRRPRAIKRSLLVDDRLHTVSSRGISAHDPETLELLGWALFD